MEPIDRHTAAPTTKRKSIIESDTALAMPTTTPAWIVCAWPRIFCQASRAPQLRFVHRGTRVFNGRGRGSPCSGQTLWADAIDRQSAGVAWDWVEVQHGVVAMADPLGLVTNLTLLGEDGQRLDDLATSIRLHRMVHGLGWQSQVRLALDAEAETDDD